MEYTVCILFSRTSDKVLMQLKDRTAYAGKLNGVGGKLKPGEGPIDCAIREIKEETGVELPFNKIYRICTLILPDDCACDRPNEICTLHFFAALVNEDEVSQQPGETESLYWISQHAVDLKPELFADVGIIQYVVHRAKREFSKRGIQPYCSQVIL